MRLPSSRLMPALAAVTAAGVLASCSALDTGDSSETASGSSSSSSGPRLTGCDGTSAPSFAGKPQAFDSVARVEAGQAVGVQASGPTMTKASSGARGWSVAQVKVHANVLTNGIFAVSPDSFMLVDAKGRQCTRPRTSSPSPMAVSEIDEKKSASGTVAFLVPDDADLSDYSVVYAGNPNARTADAKWSPQGTAPTAANAASCGPYPSPLSMAPNVARAGYGESRTVGDPKTAAVTITASKPTPRTLPPSDKNPNNVDGLAITLKVQAVGAVAFLDRKMLLLTDSRNSMCPFSELGSSGETLTSDLIPAGATRTYTLIFWTPKGSAATVKGLQLIYRPDLTRSLGLAAWYDRKENAPYPTPAPKPSAEPTKK